MRRVGREIISGAAEIFFAREEIVRHTQGEGGEWR
jgi:hypothetical protein